MNVSNDTLVLTVSFYLQDARQKSFVMEDEAERFTDSSIPITEQSLKNETLALIAFLNLHYWCEDEDEKKKLLQKYKENDKKNK